MAKNRSSSAFGLHIRKCPPLVWLLITRAIRRLAPGDLLGIRSAEATVVTDLPVWAELVGHDIANEVAETPAGPWWFSVRKDGAELAVQP